jgi:glycosyltransferase involved in cell wall biosynthesis
MDSRKGPIQLLDAALSLPVAKQKKLCLLLVGKIDPSIEHEVLARVNQLRDDGNAQVIVRNEYVPDTFVQHYYEVADVALTTYQQHKGMSSALMRAALAKVPVLSSSYGLMGELVRRHRMGSTVDTASPDAFTSGLADAIAGESAIAFNVQSSLDFANQHSPESLGAALEDWVCQISTGLCER